MSTIIQANPKTTMAPAPAPTPMPTTPTGPRARQASPERISAAEDKARLRRAEWEATLPENAVALLRPEDLGSIQHVTSVGTPNNTRHRHANHWVPSTELADWLFENTAGYRLITNVWQDTTSTYTNPTIDVAVEFKSDMEAVHFAMRWL